MIDLLDLSTSLRMLEAMAAFFTWTTIMDGLVSWIATGHYSNWRRKYMKRKCFRCSNKARAILIFHNPTTVRETNRNPQSSYSSSHDEPENPAPIKLSDYSTYSRN